MEQFAKEVLAYIFGDPVKDALYVLIILILRAVKHPDKLERIASWFYKLFAWRLLRAQKKYIEKNIVADIHGFKLEVNKEVEGIAPYGLRLEWVKEADREAFIRGDEIIVKMNHYRNQDENFVRATLAYVKRGTIDKAKPYLEEHLSKAIDYKLAKMILQRREKSSQVAFFIEEILTPEIKKSKDLEQSCIEVENIAAHGLFTRILLREFKRLGDKLYPKNPEEHIKAETKRFTDFLNCIALRDQGELANLRFYGNYLKAGVILVADKDKILSGGYEPYYKWIRRYCLSEYDAIFILAAEDTISDAENIAKKYRFQQEFSSATKSRYKMVSRSGKQVQAICIAIDVNKQEIRSKKALWRRQNSPPTKPS